MKLVYRGFATLYFIAICDEAESELGLLDLIQVFVEALDKVFENVCELDIIFNSPKVHQLLDEIIVGGTVMETDGSRVLQQIKTYEVAEKRSLRDGDAMSGSNAMGGSGNQMMGGGGGGGGAGGAIGGGNSLMMNARNRLAGGFNF